MVEILPIKHLRNEDAPYFGSLNVSLGKLQQSGLSVAEGIVVSPPHLKLKTTIEHLDFGSREVFEQSLTLFKKEIESTPAPQVLGKEVGKNNNFFINQLRVKGVKQLWLSLLNIWLQEIKQRLWKDGFYLGITEDLEPQVVTFINNPTAFGIAFFNDLLEDTILNVEFGSLIPHQQKSLVDLVDSANKKLIIPHTYVWILEGKLKITQVLPLTHSLPVESSIVVKKEDIKESVRKNSVIKVYFDLSNEVLFEEVDGVFIDSSKIFDLNYPKRSQEELILKIVEAASLYPSQPILVKLADISEGMGKIRGSFRLIHQKNLLDPLIETLDFVRHKKGLTNVQVVVPFLRSAKELVQIKRELATRNLTRKTSLDHWIEISVPENIINIEQYLEMGVDGVVLNLDELAAYIGGYDHAEEELLFYNREVSEAGGLLKFIEDGLKLIHKSKIPFIATGSLSLYPKVLEFLVEKGVYGVVVEKYEAHSIRDLLIREEKRLLFRRAT